MKNNLVIFIVLAALSLQGCEKKAVSGDTAANEANATPAASVKIAAEYDAFQAKADSTLNELDTLVAACNAKLDDPGRRRHAVRQRRELIWAQHRLDKLRERLHKRSHSYRAAVEGLNRIEKENPKFIRQYQHELKLLDSTVVRLVKDSI